MRTEGKTARCARCHSQMEIPWTEASSWCDLCRALDTQHGILSGKAIAKAVQLGLIEIEPFKAEQLNPASYDLRLGKQACTYADYSEVYGLAEPRSLGPIDARKDNPTSTFELPEEGFFLVPHVGYLLHTVERIRTEKFVPIIDGKSSIGRLFIQIHATAGYGDPGFDGQYTLEVIVTHPVRIYPGMRFAQIRFHTMVGEPELYDGNYTGEASMGPVPSKSWKQFAKKEE